MSLLLSPLARWAAVAALCAALVGWGAIERAGRQAARAGEAAARAEVAALTARIRNMEVRRNEDDRATRDPDPVRSLRDSWTRPD